MEVAGLCQVCQRPGVLQTCSLCGALAHGKCLRSGAHQHLTRGGTGPPRGNP